jgi:glycosyltransferase involved in cell wall biosynthesis
MPAVRCSVIVPTNGDGRTLRASVRSVLSQTLADLEVIVVGDGVGEEARRTVEALAGVDDRVRFLDEPAGAGAGQAHLVRALAVARGPVVAYLRDGDLWAPEHLDEVCRLLATAEVAHTLAVEVRPEGPRTRLVDAAHPADRVRLLAGEPGPPASALAHTAAAYRRLDLGWRVVGGPFGTVGGPVGTVGGPVGTVGGPVGTDDLLRQLLADPAVVARSSVRPTVLAVPAAGDRLDELFALEGQLADPAWRAEELPALGVAAALASWRGTDDRLRRIVESPPWAAVDRLATKARRAWRRLRKPSP